MKYRIFKSKKFFLGIFIFVMTSVSLLLIVNPALDSYTIARCKHEPVTGHDVKKLQLLQGETLNEIKKNDEPNVRALTTTQNNNEVCFGAGWTKGSPEVKYILYLR